MLGALVKATDIVKMETLEEVIKEEFLEKLGQSGVDKNITGLKRGYEEVKNG